MLSPISGDHSGHRAVRAPPTGRETAEARGANHSVAREEIVHKARVTVRDRATTACMPGGEAGAHVSPPDDRFVDNSQRVAPPHPAQPGVSFGPRVVGGISIRVERRSHDGGNRQESTTRCPHIRCIRKLGLRCILLYWRVVPVPVAGQLESSTHYSEGTPTNCGGMRAVGPAMAGSDYPLSI